MQGIILLSTIDYLKQNLKGDPVKMIGIDPSNIAVDKLYPASLIEKISQEVKDPNFFELIGRHLVKYLVYSNHEIVFLKEWADYRHFLYGMEKFNEFLKVYFPSTEAPVFTYMVETNGGVLLQCWSREERVLKFSIGFIQEISHTVYQTNSKFTIREFSKDFNGFKGLLEIKFYMSSNADYSSYEKYSFLLNPKLLGSIFPYSIVFSRRMRVVSIGLSLVTVHPGAEGHHLSELVILKRPKIRMSYTSIMKYSNGFFDLLIKCFPYKSSINEEGLGKGRRDLHSTETIDGVHYLRLKGRILFVKIWNMFIFFGTPVLVSLRSLYAAGINICNLSIHDFSRDLMLAEAQQTVELKMTFDQGQEKQKKLENFLQKVNEEMERTQEILSEMIPDKTVFGIQADGSVGMKPIENVTILISDIVKFTSVCSTMKPMEVVTTLNAMYSKFDCLTAKHGAQKVETIGDAYMIVSGRGSPQQVCDVALDMTQAIKDIHDPKTGSHLKIRIGIHTGAVVAGIVGLKVPKFCLFGTTVKTAVLLEASSFPMKIKISEVTRKSLCDQYDITESDPVLTQCSGILRTYWLNSKLR